MKTSLREQNIAGRETLQPGELWVWHVHGFGQYMGTVKMHLYPDCFHLLKWKPEGSGTRFQLAKILMKNCYPAKMLGDDMTCKRCREQFLRTGGSFDAD